MRPRRSLSDGAVRVLLAVQAGAVTYTELIEATGLARVTIHHHLHRLRDEGLVDFADATRGTLHATSTEVIPSPNGRSCMMVTEKRSGRAPASTGPDRGRHLIGGDDGDGT